MTDQPPTLRAQRRSQTQRTIQSHAVRLFGERGYDATTVADVAEAAGVSPMTVYRHFPTKEDLVLVDQQDRIIAERVAASSTAQPLVRRIGGALVDAATTLTGEGHGRGHGGSGSSSGPAADRQHLLARLRLMVSTPALRARHLDNHYALQQAIVDALGVDAADPEAAFRAQAAASACLAAMNTALVRWTEEDGSGDLAALIARALAASFGDDFTGV